MSGIEMELSIFPRIPYMAIKFHADVRVNSGHP